MSALAASVPMRLPVGRARLVLALLIMAFAVMIGRAVYLQALHTTFLKEKGEARYARVIETPATRGRIVDRHGVALAVSTPVKSVWAIPDEVQASPAQMTALAALLGMDLREISRRLEGAESRDFVYLKRQLSPEIAERVAALDIPGVLQHEEYRRYYPGGEVTAHLVGFTGVDDAGQEGVELAFQPTLSGKPGRRRVIRDRRGNIVEDRGAVVAAQNGRDIALSIDNKIQSMAYGALKAAVTRHRARAGALVAIDVRSGEVLALANVPSYNPNNRAQLDGGKLRNRALTDMFEPGSTLKPFTVALALENGRATPATVIPTAPGRLTVGSYTIHDAHPAKAMTLVQVLQKSSNVGVAKLALALPSEAMWDVFRRIGLGRPTQVAFPGEAAGRLRHFRNWRPIEQATMAYGHGISVNLLQLARAYTVFARDGDLAPITLTRSAGVSDGEKVFSAQTARAVRAMLEAATGADGTGPRARIPGWRVAGKTGTAHKLVNGGYAPDRYISSFVGLAPASAPRLVVAVMIDEPSGGQYYGGVVAAPVFAQTMQGALRLLGVPLDAAPTPLELPGEFEDAREST